MDGTTLFITSWITIATFVIGLGVGWFISLRYNEWIEHAAYSKVLFHPEMYDKDGSLSDEGVLFVNLDDYNFQDEDDDE